MLSPAQKQTHPPQKLSAVDKYITEIDQVDQSLRDIDTLFLSNNSISELGGLRQFRRLRVLSMVNNLVCFLPVVDERQFSVRLVTTKQVSSLTELDTLANLPNLQVLNLEYNPITQIPNYRYHVIVRAPKLAMLDNKVQSPISAQNAAASLFCDSDSARVVVNSL